MCVQYKESEEVWLWFSMSHQAYFNRPETGRIVVGKLTCNSNSNTLPTKEGVIVNTKLTRPFQILCLLMAVLTFSMPFVALAQQDLRAEARIAAELDARNDVNTGLWFLGGCLGGVIGIVVAYAVEPSPPATRLLGKSPEYVAYYTDAYTETAKKRQANSALGGCVVNAIATAAYVVLIIAAAENDGF